MMIDKRASVVGGLTLEVGTREGGTQERLIVEDVIYWRLIWYYDFVCFSGYKVCFSILLLALLTLALFIAV